MAYLWFKSFHIISFVAWFAGLFYLPRLFVYHIEADTQPEPNRTILKEEYHRIEKLLFKLIMMPAMIVTIVMGASLISTEPEIFKQTWLHIKLFLVLLLIGFHFYCGRVIHQLETGNCSVSGLQMRRINEIPTILLALIILLAIFKNYLPASITVLGTLIAVLLFAVVIQVYARKRRLQQQKDSVLSVSD
jgi:protoporphyrinogen IX oxidase